jgi:hypothetical protein
MSTEEPLAEPNICAQIVTNPEALRRHATGQHVYFIQSGEGGPVKIGVADNVKGRLAGLQTNHHNKLRLIGVIPNGGREATKLLHKQFKAFRLAGEWFEWNPELAEAVQ